MTTLVANHTEGTVSIWNNGDGNDLITLGAAGEDRGLAHNLPFDDGAGGISSVPVDPPPVGFIFDLSLSLSKHTPAAATSSERRRFWF